MIYVFLAEGFEEIEALAPVDVLRRAGVEVKTVGIGSKTVTGAHGISVICDLDESEAAADSSLEGIVLPGGMPGTLNLKSNPTVDRFVDFAYENGLIVSAICAAPSILGEKGILKGKKATCYCGFEEKLKDAIITNEPVVRDGNIITAYGAGAALQFAFALAGALKGNKAADALKVSMRFAD